MLCVSQYLIVYANNIVSVTGYGLDFLSFLVLPKRKHLTFNGFRINSESTSFLKLFRSALGADVAEGLDLSKIMVKIVLLMIKA